MAFVLGLLGQTALYKDGVLMAGRATQKRRLGLLAYLVQANGRPVSRDKIVGLLWPEMSPEQSRKVLSEAIYIIRKELGADALQSIGDEVLLNEKIIQSDVRDFEQACAAGMHQASLALYTGPFMDGWFPDDAEEFEQWMSGERARLSRLHLKSLQALAEHAESVLDLRLAAHYRSRLVQAEPYSSSHALKLAQLSERLGEAGEAVRVLAEHARRLRDELGAEAPAHVMRYANDLKRGSTVTVESASPSTTLQAVASLPEGRDPARDIDDNGERHRRPRWRPYAVIGVPLILLASLGWGLTRIRETQSKSAERNRIAILYLRDVSVQQDLGPIADGITEALTVALSGVNAFDVIPTSGTKQFRGESLALDSVARALHVQSVVDGSIQRVDNRLMITVRLSDGKTGAVISSSSYDRSTDDLFRLQHEIAQDIASQMRQRLGQQVRLRESINGSSNLRATRLMLRANRERDDAMRLVVPGDSESIRSAKRGLSRADSLFAEASKNDVAWVAPLLGRGHAAIKLASLSEGHSRAATLAAAIRFADSALARKSDLAGAFELRGMLRWGILHANAGERENGAELSRTVHDLEQAVELDSTRAQAWMTLANLYWITGDPTRAYRAGEHAFAADAYLEGGARVVIQIVYSAIERGALKDAARWCDLGRHSFPNDYQFTLCALTILKYDTQAPPDQARAWQLVAQLDTIDPASTAQRAGHAYTPVYRRLAAAAVSARAGDTVLARNELARAKRQAAGDREMLLDIASDEANILMLMGRRADAANVLRQLIKARPLMHDLAAKDPILSKLISDGSAGLQQTR